MELKQQPVQNATNVSKWSNRFIWAAIIQGFAAVLLTIPIVWPTGLLGMSISPAVAQVIASGSAGTWFTVGYLTYVMVGVIAVGLTALFYHHFEVELNKPYTGVANYLAWIQLVLMNVGVAAACYLLMYGGYYGQAALMAGKTAEWVHVNILSGLVNPIGYAIITAGVGVLAGGLGFLLDYFRK